MEVMIPMENGDFEYRSRGASRPPEPEGGSGASRETPLFTEVPLSSVRRTPNSGRPDYRSPSPGKSSDSFFGGAYEGRSPNGNTGYGGRSARPTRPAPDYTQYAGTPRQPSRSSSRPSATFTEISWDSLREGRYDAPAAPPPAESRTPYRADPYGGVQTPPQPEQDPFFTGRAPTGQSREPDYRQYSQPARSDTRRFSADRSAPAYRPGVSRTPVFRTAGSRTRRTAPPVTPPPMPSRPASGGSRPPRRRGLHPIFYVIALVLVALLIFGVSKLAGSVRNRTPRATPVQYIPGSAVTPSPVPTAPPESQHGADATPEITPTPSPEPTPTPSGPKAVRSGNRIVPADWGVVVPERRRTVYDSFFDKSCMIGNSLVEGFKMWSGVTNIRYIPDQGAVVTNVIGVMDLAPLTLNPPGYYTDIYLMFGLNEVGTGVSSFLQGYQKLVDFVRQYQPDANIYIISITPVTQKVDEDPNEVQSMERIDNFNASLKEFCKDNECWYLDIYSMLINGDGYLSSAYAYEEDGKHFEKSGYVAWANYMKTHYVDDALPTE